MTTSTRRPPRSIQVPLTLALIVVGVGAIAQEAPEAAASRVTLQGRGIRLDEALRRLRQQTGNPVTDARDAPAANPALDLDLKDVPFLQALDAVAGRANVGLSPFTGDGSIGVVPGPAPAGRFVSYAGPFRFELTRITVQRDYQTGATTAVMALEATWEPRLRPMLLALKAETLEVRDDQGRIVRPRVAGEAIEIVSRPETPSVQFTANLEAPERSAARLATIKGRVDATIPVDPKTFRFALPAKSNAEEKQGGVVATLVKVEVDQHLWRFLIDLDYPASGPAFESFRQGLFDNRIRLEKADGSRVRLNGGSSATGAGEGRLRFEYLFQDVPGRLDDYQLVYEAPGRVIVAPLEFEFHDAPLP